MKKVLLITLAGLGLALTSCYKDRVDPFPPGNGGGNTYTFVDEFDNNKNDWSFADQVNDAYGVISGGTFSFNFLDPNGIAYYRSKDIRFNPDKNFTIETRVGSDNNMGLSFGFDDDRGAYGYSFMVSHDGYYALWDEGGNGGSTDIEQIVPPTYSNLVNPNGNWNDLKIAQVGNNWEGYLNGTRVFTVRARYVVKGSVGFVIVGNTRGEADFIQADFY